MVSDPVKAPEATMITTNALLHFAAYGLPLPAAASVPTKLVNETVYLPSAVAVRLLGTPVREGEGSECAGKWEVRGDELDVER